MPQSQALSTTLKKSLKSQGLTYRDVAGALELSEASVKRLFAEQSFSLQRLEQVCQLAGLEISDLVKQMESGRQVLDELSESQEQELVSDIRLLLVAFLVINGWTFDEILRHYRISETEAIRYLARLDRIKLIDLLPNNRIKLRISANFAWRRNGPIQQFFTSNLQEDFLKSRFDEHNESFQFLSGMFTRISADQVRLRLQQLAMEFHQYNQQDRNKSIEERDGYSLLMAFRPWRPDVFVRLRREIEDMPST
jgi:transcriptional regulator with XRE-family HTH domain